MSIFRGYKLKTEQNGYLSEKDQDALIKYVLGRAANDPLVSHEIRLVLEGRRDVGELSTSTLALLRKAAQEWIAAHRSK